MKKVTLFLLFLQSSITIFSQECLNHEGPINYAANWKDNGLIESKTIVTDGLANINKCIRFADGSGGSIAYNDQDFKGNWLQKYSGKCLCFDFKIDYDVTVEPERNYAPKIMIYTGSNPQNGSNWSVGLVFATFISNNNVNIDDKWYNYCLPISLCQNGQLPSNEFGKWVITGADPCQTWNNIIQNVTGIIITTDYNSSTSELVYFDNFCANPCPGPVSSVCCPELKNLISNPYFDNKKLPLGFTSQYTYDSGSPSANSLLPGEQAIITPAEAKVICSQWGMKSYCSENFLAINGATNQPGNTPKLIWQQTINIKNPAEYKFCAKFRNLQPCCFPITPKVDIKFSVPGNDILGQSILDPNMLSVCEGWRQIEKRLMIPNGTTNITIQIFLHENVSGDGNDLGIDDIAFVELPQTPKDRTAFGLVPKNLSPTTLSFTATPVDTNLKECGVWWKVCEYDATAADKCKTGTAIENPSQWWTYPTPVQFWGYNYLNPSALSGTNPGVFDASKTYRFEMGVYCACTGWNSTVIIYDAKGKRILKP